MSVNFCILISNKLIVANFVFDSKSKQCVDGGAHCIVSYWAIIGVVLSLLPNDQTYMFNINKILIKLDGYS